jgi:hypothetical protein
MVRVGERAGSPREVGDRCRPSNRLHSIWCPFRKIQGALSYRQTSLVWTVRLSVLYSIVCYPNIFKCPYSVNKNYYTRRDLEYISRCPTFGDFVTIRTEASMQDVTVARQHEYKSTARIFKLLMSPRIDSKVPISTHRLVSR